MDFIPCDKCENGWKFSEDGYAIKCDCLKQFQKNSTISLFKSKANIEEHNCFTKDLKIKDEDLLSKIRYYSSNLDGKTSKNCHLYFYGKNNCSKSFTAKSILLDACEKSINCKFITMGDLLELITDSFADEEKKKLIDSYLNCKLLVIDDSFDKNKCTVFRSGFQLGYIDRFLRKRLETLQLNTIFTSNVKIEDVEKNGFSYDLQNLIERTILLRKGFLEFKDIFVAEENNIDIKSIWD